MTSSGHHAPVAVLRGFRIVLRASSSSLYWGIFALLQLLLGPAAQARVVVGGEEASAFERAVRDASLAIESGAYEEARLQLGRALERDPKSQEAWELRARLAAAEGDLDLELYSSHVRYRLAVAQGADKKRLKELRTALETQDERARALLDLRDVFVDKLLPVAEQYEKDRRWHSAIRVHQQILALDPEREESRATIERISSQPDPSLAETAKPKDLFEDVSEEWMAQFDLEHATWDTRGKLERENYFTHTDAGYEVLLKAGEAMEQMNAFYREFFRYGTEEDGRSVPRITLRIFQNRDEYLTLGAGPPVEWSAGHFIGSAVETYVQGTFDDTVGVLFHEAAHQFVGLATSAVGWLNEGLASFFEGCRILGNGTVLMNLPANHRLFPLATRMEKGWMADSSDGIDPANASGSEPEKAPTFRIVLENRYAWGPPWYAPTWGVVYFLYNFQDPVDGRFVYRDAFHEFIDASGGRSGDGAVENFEEVVLAHPSKPMKGVDYGSRDPLPRTCEELDPVWKAWTLALRDEMADRVKVERPYHQWATYAVERKEFLVAKEHFEKGMQANPEDVDLLVDFGDLLATRFKNPDRATKLALEALRLLEAQEKPDQARIDEVDRLLAKWDPKRKSLDRIHIQLEATARGLATQYLDAGLPTMAMEVSWRLGTELGYPALFEIFEQGLRAGGRSLELWRLAYDEHSLDGWDSGGSNVWKAMTEEIASEFGSVRDEGFQFQFLTYDTTTSGDYSFEAELFAEGSMLSFAGLVFGRKSATDFHGLVFFPGHPGDEAYGRKARQDFLDLTTFHGGNDYEIHRHNPLGDSRAAWHRLRVDVIGSTVDLWFDEQLVATQEFQSPQSLRGGFGLMTGPGAARWRNVRYLSRSPRDIGARIERDLRMQERQDAAQASGEAMFGGTFVGRVPPFPQAKRWVRGPISSFDELGPVPVLLAFFSIGQDRSLPITGWLKALAEEQARYGLHVVGIASWEDDRAMDEYAREVDFPGSLAIDERKGVGYGETFEAYAIHKFGMPRLLLLDVDHTVCWEGDPGFTFADPWRPGMETYLQTPLRQLVERRHLDEIEGWLKYWRSVAEPSLRLGQIEPVWKSFEDLTALAGAEAIPEVGEVRRKRDILDAALVGIEVTAQQLVRAQAEGALPTLLAWAARRGLEIDATTQKDLRPVLTSPAAKAWAEIERSVQKALPKMSDDPRTLAAAQKLLDDSAKDPGVLVERFRSALQGAVDRGSAGEVRRVVERVFDLPGRWLLEVHFGWIEGAGS